MKIIQQTFTVPYSFPVIFTRDAFGLQNPALCQAVSNSGRKRNRALIVIDAGVVQANPQLPEKIEKYAAHHDGVFEFVDSPFIVRGGEICKQEPVEMGKIQALVEKHRLCRHSFILAIGGGAVLDAAGYAAATAHRGIRLIRMPATTLAQNDAGIGVKTGINAYGRKNYLGTFTPPYAVINDFDFLDTLPARDKRAGIAEAVKVALIKDRSFFDFLYRGRHKLARFETEIMETMIIRCAELHLEHIRGGDPFEYGTARPLDFGHWSAHKLEELTGGAVKHGEAVAIGVALDSLYSWQIGKITEMEAIKILLTLEDIGFTLHHWSLGWMDIEKALAEFQEHLGGELAITLLKGLGGKEEVNRIDGAVMKRCIDMLSERKKNKEKKNGHTMQTEISQGNAGHVLHRESGQTS